MTNELEKEYLEDLDHYDEGMGIHSTSYEKCKERLIRLAKIDNSNPSEALECLENLKKQAIAFERSELAIKVANGNADTIKQALLKSQEQEVDTIHYKGTIENLRRDNALLKDIKNEQEKLLDVIKEYIMPLVNIDDDCVWDNEGYGYLVPKKEDLILLKKFSEE